MKSLKNLLNNIKVYDCDFEKIRIGNNYDGGYIGYKEICEKTKNVVSIGVEDNVSFDLDFVSKFPQANVHLYDHTVDRLPTSHNNFTFYKVGVGPQKSDELDTLETFTRELDENTLLKMDIEWNEWEIFNSLEDRVLKKFSQMFIEFHLVHIDLENNYILSQENLTPYFRRFYSDIYDQINNNLFALYANAFAKISKYFYLFHIHANNSLPKSEINNIKFPPLLELSFVRKDLVNEANETRSQFPINGLDYANKPHKEDIIDIYPLI
jgi:hypothetical protein